MSGETRVLISGTDHRFAQKIETGQHVLSADEPIDVGGTDAGPTPYELLLAALGSCIAITLRMYAGKKAWNLTNVIVELTHRKIHAADCADCEQEMGFVDVIEKKIELEGNLTEEQKTRLLEIAGRCPVHRTLENSVKIR